jgi:hypothetical protein
MEILISFIAIAISAYAVITQRKELVAQERALN